MAPKLHIPVGIPGCGKSTFGALLGAEIVSTDAIRARMGDVNDQSNNDVVFQRYHAEITRALVDGWNVYADATNLRDFARAKLREIAERTGATTHAWVFINTGQAVVRNGGRERVVPNDVMQRMIAQFEKAERDMLRENYTTVTHIDGVR